MKRYLYLLHFLFLNAMQHITDLKVIPLQNKYILIFLIHTR